MKYSQDTLEEMANKIDLLEYAGHTVDFVKRSGNTYYAVCPFHSEKTASLAVNTADNYWHCFGCLRSGNIYNWIMLTEHLTFDQAVQKVATLTNSDINGYVESESLNFYKLLNKINAKHEKVDSERHILDIESDYRQKFSNELPQEWMDEGISAEELKKYEIMIDPMSNRIVYPVYSNDDQLISIKGRTRFKNFKDLKIAKYMNYFAIGKLDYFQGMQQARSAIKESGEIIIFEGIKSVMKVDQWKFHNAVSAETSKLNEYQIELLIKMQIRDVVIAFDQDVKIDKIRKCTELLKRFTNVWVVYDKWSLLKEKDSPCDQGEKIFRTLYERKIRL